jgi:hypothetical protein
MNLYVTFKFNRTTSFKFMKHILTYLISLFKNLFMNKDKRELIYKRRLLNNTIDSFPFNALVKEFNELNWQWANPETGDVACPSINQLIEFCEENLQIVYSDCKKQKSTMIKQTDGFVFIANFSELTQKVKDLQIIFDKSAWYQK